MGIHAIFEQMFILDIFNLIFLYLITMSINKSKDLLGILKDEYLFCVVCMDPFDSFPILCS